MTATKEVNQDGKPESLKDKLAKLLKKLGRG